MRNFSGVRAFKFDYNGIEFRVSTEAASIQIAINGKPVSVPQGQTVLGLLESLEIKPDRVAVELNRRIVKQREWSATELVADAEVEIVHFVGGG